MTIYVYTCIYVCVSLFMYVCVYMCIYTQSLNAISHIYLFAFHQLMCKPKFSTLLQLTHFLSSARNGGSTAQAGTAAANSASALGMFLAELGKEQFRAADFASVFSVFRGPLGTTGTLGDHMGIAVGAVALASP